MEYWHYYLYVNLTIINNYGNKYFNVQERKFNIHLTAYQDVQVNTLQTQVKRQQLLVSNLYNTTLRITCLRNIRKQTK